MNSHPGVEMKMLGNEIWGKFPNEPWVKVAEFRVEATTLEGSDTEDEEPIYSDTEAEVETITWINEGKEYEVNAKISEELGGIYEVYELDDNGEYDTCGFVTNLNNEYQWIKKF